MRIVLELQTSVDARGLYCVYVAQNLFLYMEIVESQNSKKMQEKCTQISTDFSGFILIFQK